MRCSTRMFVPLAAVTGLLFVGCGNGPTESLGDFQPALYVEGFLRAGNTVDSLFVGITTPLYETTSRGESGLPEATVILEVDGTASTLQPLTGKPGYYHLPTLRVEPGKTYRLTVEAEGGMAQAETTVPFPPTVVASSTDLKLNEDPFAATWSGETEGGYVTTRKSVALGESIPIEVQFGGGFGRFGGFGGGFPGGVDTTGFVSLRDSLAGAEQWRYVQNRSAVLDWRQFTRYGTYAFVVYAIDENYADFLVSSRQDPQVLDEPHRKSPAAPLSRRLAFSGLASLLADTRLCPQPSRKGLPKARHIFWCFNFQIRQSIRRLSCDRSFCIME